MARVLTGQGSSFQTFSLKIRVHLTRLLRGHRDDGLGMRQRLDHDDLDPARHDDLDERRALGAHRWCCHRVGADPVDLWHSHDRARRLRGNHQWRNLLGKHQPVGPSDDSARPRRATCVASFATTITAPGACVIFPENGWQLPAGTAAMFLQYVNNELDRRLHWFGAGERQNYYHLASKGESSMTVTSFSP